MVMVVMMVVLMLVAGGDVQDNLGVPLLFSHYSGQVISPRHSCTTGPSSATTSSSCSSNLSERLSQHLQPLLVAEKRTLPANSSSGGGKRETQQYQPRLSIGALDRANSITIGSRIQR